MPKSKLIAPQAGRRLDALDPRTLGRPFHLLPVFTQALQDDIDLFLGVRLNRRYHARFGMTGVRCSGPADTLSRSVMQRFSHSMGHIDIAIDRSLLLRMLDYRYGGGWQAGSAATDPADVAITETELRLQAALGADIALVTLGTLARLNGAPLPSTPPRRSGQPGAQSNQSCEITLEIADQERDCAGSIALRLDAELFEWLMQAVGASRRSTPGGEEAPRLVLEDHVRVRLAASLLTLTLPLGEVLDLKIGQIIPAPMRQRADVHVGHSRLFTASVADNAGKLCLTAFDDVE